MIRWNEEAKMYFVYINNVAFMKNSKKSTLMSKFAKWLKSQGQ